MHYLFCKLLLENPLLKNLNISIGTLKCCLAMYLGFDLCFYLLIVFVCMCVPSCIRWCACGLQRTACGNWFSFSTLPGLTASTIICWAILPASFINRLTSIWTFTNYFPNQYLFFYGERKPQDTSSRQPPSWRSALGPSVAEVFPDRCLLLGGAALSGCVSFLPTMGPCRLHQGR